MTAPRSEDDLSSRNGVRSSPPSTFEPGEEKLRPGDPGSPSPHATPGDHDVALFIRSNFRSVWALELLLLLRSRGGFLTHDEMVKGLRGSDLIVTQSLESLTIAGLVVCEANGTARYSTVSDELDAKVAAAELHYRRSPDAVRRWIVASVNPGITAFADAFKLRKD